MRDIEKDLAVFLLKFPGKWHSVKDDKLTMRAVNFLEKHNVLSINDHKQIRLKDKTRALCIVKSFKVKES